MRWYDHSRMPDPGTWYRDALIEGFEAKPTERHPGRFVRVGKIQGFFPDEEPAGATRTCEVCKKPTWLRDRVCGGCKKETAKQLRSLRDRKNFAAEPQRPLVFPPPSDARARERIEAPLTPVTADVSQPTGIRGADAVAVDRSSAPAPRCLWPACG
jgi:hypothetical protein